MKASKENYELNLNKNSAEPAGWVSYSFYVVSEQCKIQNRRGKLGENTLSHIPLLQGCQHSAEFVGQLIKGTV